MNLADLASGPRALARATRGELEAALDGAGCLWSRSRTLSPWLDCLLELVEGT